MRLRRRGKYPLNHRVAPQGAIEDESHPVTVDFRNAISQFFSKAEHKLTK
jgi:hypothetical protein